VSSRDLRIAAVEVLILDGGVEYGTIMDDGEVAGPRHTCLVRVTSEDGFVGHADVDSNPWVVKAVVEAPSHIPAFSTGLAEAVVGQSARDPEALWERMYRHSWYFGRRGAALHAISGIDIAVWDLLGRAEGRPVSELLGGARRDRVPAYASTLFRPTAAEMRSAARGYLEHGFRAIKFGWATWGSDVDLDHERLAAARDEVGSEVALMVDGYIEGAFDDVVAHVRAMEDLAPTWVEEPLPADRPADLAALGRSTSIPIATGEQLGGDEFGELLAARGVSFVQPDLSRCGGFTAARRIAAQAAERGCRVVPHAWTSPLLTAASLHMNASLADATFIECNASTAPVVRALAPNPPQLVDGALEVPTGPGLGVDVDPAVIDRFRVA
jgi:L-alanine-DL-glutamate epimerase-like enolase superfamily enzyme